MTDEARKARNAYYRSYYSQNKEKIRAIQQRYWERKTSKPAEDPEREPATAEE